MADLCVGGDRAGALLRCGAGGVNLQVLRHADVHQVCLSGYAVRSIEVTAHPRGDDSTTSRPTMLSRTGDGQGGQDYKITPWALLGPPRRYPYLVATARKLLSLLTQRRAREQASSVSADPEQCRRLSQTVDCARSAPTLFSGAFAQVAARRTPLTTGTF